jgi:predicted transcriptional regulator
MNILVIGNGFDLAHGLPTRYTDFLKFINVFLDYKKNCEDLDSDDQEKYSYIDDNDEERDYLFYFQKLFDKNKKLYKELQEVINKNTWLKFFIKIYYKRGTWQKERWIDFELEISQMIQYFDKFMDVIKEQAERGNKEIEIEDQLNQLLNNLSDIMKETVASIKSRLKNEICVLPEIDEDLKELEKQKHKLIKDLNKLIRCLEIYLSDFINNSKIEYILPDIKSLPNINKVLSFNYTNTYEKLYKKKYITEIDYIHGKANRSNTIESNNMVLGIDEYLPDDRKNKDVEFIAFKKYYQRIYKQTGCKYKEWVDEIKADKNKNHSLTIFGHSLDITDKDILRDLILNDNVYTTIFYPDKEELGRKIANLVKVIGQDELIRRTGGSTKTIEFRLQQNMIERESS